MVGQSLMHPSRIHVRKRCHDGLQTRRVHGVAASHSWNRMIEAIPAAYDVHVGSAWPDPLWRIGWAGDLRMWYNPSFAIWRSTIARMASHATIRRHVCCSKCRARRVWQDRYICRDYPSFLGYHCSKRMNRSTCRLSVVRYRDDAVRGASL